MSRPIRKYSSHTEEPEERKAGFDPTGKNGPESTDSSWLVLGSASLKLELGIEMNQSELIEKVARAADLNQTAAGQAVRFVVSVILDSLAAGEAVRVSGLGTFNVAARPAREGRNPRSGETIKIKTVPSQAATDSTPPPIARLAKGVRPRCPTTAVSTRTYSGSAARTTRAGRASPATRRRDALLRVAVVEGVLSPGGPSTSAAPRAHGRAAAPPAPASAGPGASAVQP